MRIQNSQPLTECLGIIDSIADFYDKLSFTTFQMPTLGVKGLVNIDMTILESLKSTLETIAMALRKGHVADAFSLLRKLFDDVVVQIYCAIRLSAISLPELHDAHVQQWVSGKQPLPRIGEMLKAIAAFDGFGDLWKLFLLDNRYRAIREYCNSNLHSNYFPHLFVNTDMHIEPATAARIFGRFRSFLVDIAVLHFACLLSVNFQYMTSSDYVDHLEVGMRPPKDSEYWVAPYVQQFFDQVIKARRPDIANWIVRNTPMQLR